MIYNITNNNLISAVRNLRDRGEITLQQYANCLRRYTHSIGATTLNDTREDSSTAPTVLAPPELFKWLGVDYSGSC